MMTPSMHESVQQSLAPFGSASVSHNVVVCELERHQFMGAVNTLKYQQGFDVFLDVTAVDWPNDALRFEVVHHFYSTTKKIRVRLKCRVPESAPIVPTLREEYGSANYMERECHDMYGIKFEGNDDLRAILLYEGFVGHPLRKDYPKQLEQPLVPYRF